jgi:hypothetical protein
VVLAEVGQDAEEPGPDAVCVTTRVKLLEALYQGPLHQVGGVVLTPRHAQRVAVEHVAVPTHQEPICVAISSQDIADDLRIGSFHR